MGLCNLVREEIFFGDQKSGFRVSVLVVKSWRQSPTLTADFDIIC